MNVKKELLIICVLVIFPTMLRAAPQDQQVFTDFENFAVPEIFGGIYEVDDTVDVTIGESPIKAVISGGTVFGGDFFFQFIHSPENQLAIFNGDIAIITFETPAIEVQFYASVLLLNDGSIEVFDTNNNLLTTVTDLPSNINPIEVPDAPFISFNAIELGAPSGIGKILIRDDEEIVSSFNISITSIDDFGFTPIANFELPTEAPLILDGSGDIAGENIMHSNGNIFDQVLLTGESIRLQARPNQITRVSFMDENEDIVQVEFSGAGTFTVTLAPSTFLPPALPPRYNQAVEYVTGKSSVIIDGADSTTFFSIFTVGSINAVNQALFPEGQVYDAQADVTLVEVINSTGIGGIQLSNTVFSGSTGKVGVDARGVPIAVRLTLGDIDASGDAVPHLLFGEGSFTVVAGNPGLRITGGDLVQTNGASIVVAESGSTTRGFDRLITQNNFKSDNIPQPTRSINATFANEDGQEISVTVDEVTIE